MAIQQILKRKGTKVCLKSALKKLEKTRTKLFLNLYAEFEQFITKVYFENVTSWEVLMII